MKAVIIYLDTPGGDAFACMEIAKYVEELARIKPVVAVMGPYCASGGITLPLSQSIFLLKVIPYQKHRCNNGLG